MEREQCELGVLIGQEQPAGEALAEANKAGVHVSPLSGERYQRLQLLTASDLQHGKGIDYPGVRENLTGSAPARKPPRRPVKQIQHDEQIRGETQCSSGT